ncbi:rhomboid-like protein [Streptomyces morookaense]|uniref:rhomboid-like protein n=1 Tax=Streptomyces morookaense TaxID=1970 RepID=UPI001983D25C|nr:rhomboid-like protein [Streptomyces morookaense]GHF27073.1 membrane protein [Streptomyces morookaense]
MDAARLWSTLRTEVGAWVRSSPGTHIWLLIIGVTSLVIASASEGLSAFLLHRNSSNIHELNKHPLQSLLISGFWIEQPSSFLLYAVLFEIFHANVERWIGTLRWLVTVAVAHVAATLISQEVLLLAIQHHSAPRAMKHVVDIGVSYGLAAAAGILAYRVPRPWRWPYLAGVLLFFALPLATGGTFTDIGHAISVALGLACWPLTRDCPTWDFGRLTEVPVIDRALRPFRRKDAPERPRSRPRRSTR